ncbi:MAG: hypothetical protein J1E31_01260 [Helicobacter sp.]|nr:hypothetical protein [Helicobacter sp.]
MCEKYEIPLIFYNNARVEKTSLQFLLDREGKQDTFNSFTCCHMANQCVQLRKGRLYTCNVAANAWIFNKKFTQTLEESPNDYIDIHKATSFAEISNFLARPIPFCKYCKVYEWKSIGKWKTSSKTLEEYTQKYEE